MSLHGFPSVGNTSWLLLLLTNNLFPAPFIPTSQETCLSCTDASRLYNLSSFRKKTYFVIQFVVKEKD